MEFPGNDWGQRDIVNKVIMLNIQGIPKYIYIYMRIFWIK